MRFEAFVRAFLIHAHQKRIARHIEGEDRSKTAGRGHGCGSPPWGDRTGLNYSTAPTPRPKPPSTYRCGQSVSSSRRSSAPGFGFRTSPGAVQDRVAAVGLTMLGLRPADVRQFGFSYQSSIPARLNDGFG